MSAPGSTIFLAALLGLTVVLGVAVLFLEQPRRLGQFSRTRYATTVVLGLSTLAIIGLVVA